MEQKKNVQNKKRRKNRLFLLILFLFITAGVGGTATYAWFTANTSVTVDTMTVNVATSGGISISATAMSNSWESKIGTDEINGAKGAGYSTATNQMPTILQPVSTAAAELDGGYMKMYLGTVENNDDGQLILTSSDVSTVTNTTSNDDANFISFDMFLRLDNTVKKDNGEKANIYLKDATIKHKTGNNGIENAARVAFIFEGEVETKFDTATAKYQEPVATDASAIYIWEPNATSHTDSAKTDSFSKYKVNAGTTAMGYYGLIDTIADNENISIYQDLTEAGKTTGYYKTYEDKFAPVTVSNSTASDAEINFPVFQITPGYTAKVKVYIWIEGQDVDCENDASGGSVDIDLSFGIASQN